MGESCTNRYVFVKGEGLDPYIRFLEGLVDRSERVVVETVKLNSVTLKGVREDKESVKLRERLKSLSDSSSDDGDKLVFDESVGRLENVLKGTLKEKKHLLSVLDYFVADGEKMFVETRPVDPDIDTILEVTEETKDALNIKLKGVEGCILPETGFSWSHGEDVYTVEGKWVKGPGLRVDILNTCMESKGMDVIETVPEKKLPGFLEKLGDGREKLYFDSSIERDRVLNRFEKMKKLYSSNL